MNTIYPKTKSGTIFRPEYDLYGYQGWPTVCKDEKGVLYTVWSGFRVQHICPFGKTAMSVSHDQGKTWSCPIIVNDTVLDDRDAGILSLGNGKLLLSWFTHYTTAYTKTWRSIILEHEHLLQPDRPLLEAGLEYLETLSPEEGAGDSYVRLSDNNGMTWSEKISVPVSAPHGPIMLTDGTVLYFGKVLEYAERETKHWPIAAYASSDGGKTWRLRGEVPMPEGLIHHNFHEPHVLQLPNGRLLGAIRVHLDPSEDPSFTVYTTFSDDGGVTWSVPQPTGMNGSPPHLLLHSSGAVICTYGRRCAPFGQRAAISRDGGLTWSEDYVLCDHLPDGDLGYPASVELDDGSILTVCYEKCPGDHKTSIRYYVWNL